MSRIKEIIVTFDSQQAEEDRQSFSRSLQNQFHVGVYLEPQMESAGRCKFFVLPLPRMAYGGKKLVDVVANEAQNWLDRRKVPTRVDLSNADGHSLCSISNRCEGIKQAG
jgi:hypothetical protein